MFVRSKLLRHLPRRVVEAADRKAQWKERRRAKKRKLQRHPYRQLLDPDKEEEEENEEVRIRGRQL